jgi:hypothetical protein
MHGEPGADQHKSRVQPHHGFGWSWPAARRPVVRSICLTPSSSPFPVPSPHHNSPSNGVSRFATLKDACPSTRFYQSAPEDPNALKCAIENAQEPVQGPGRLRLFFWPRRATLLTEGSLVHRTLAGCSAVCRVSAPWEVPGGTSDGRLVPRVPTAQHPCSGSAQIVL